MSKIKVKIPKRIGKISPKNKLNDLTGSEWLYFLCSVFTTSYSTKGAESFSHHIRKQKAPILGEDEQTNIQSCYSEKMKKCCLQINCC